MGNLSTSHTVPLPLQWKQQTFKAGNNAVSFEILIRFVFELSNKEIHYCVICVYLDEKHHRNLNKASGDIQEGAAGYSKGNVWRFVSLS